MKSTDILVTLQEYRRKHPAKSISFEMEGELVAEVERLREERDEARAEAATMREWVPAHHGGEHRREEDK
jgi:hypothetical protein